MTKARTLANFISDNNEFADGTISVSEVSGAAPLASPTFTGNVGIGVTPATFYGRALHVHDTGTAGANIRLTDSNSGTTGNDGMDIIQINNTSYIINREAGGMNFYTGGELRYTIQGDGTHVFNENSLDSDFRVESDTQSHMLFVDAANDKVGIATVPSSRLHIKDTNTSTGSTNPPHLRIEGNNGLFYDIGRDNAGTGFLSFYGNQLNANGYIFGGANGERMRINENGTMIHQQGAVFNEVSSSQDFRVESNNYGHMLFVDGVDDTVNINRSATGSGLLNIKRNTSGNSIFLYNANNNYPTSGTGNSDITAGFYDYLTGGDYAGGTAKLRFESSNAYVGNRSARITLRASPNDGTNVDREMARFHPDQITFNELGYDQDFRVESDGNASAFFVDADQDTVHIGGSGGNYVANIYANTVNSPTGTLYVNAALNNSGRGVFIDAATRNSSEDSTRLLQVRDRHAYNALTVNVGGTVEVNDDGGSWGDFRVESDGATHMLYVDAGNDCVNIASTQTEAMFGGGAPSDGYVKQFYKSGAVKFKEFGASSSTPSQTITVPINLNSYRGVCVKINTSGHLYNNGGAFFNRVNEFYLAIESSSQRINSRVDIVAAGTQIGNCGVPTCAVSATGQFTISQTIGAGYTANVFIEVTGIGTVSVGSITKS